jgi:hypothetical protein
MLPHALLIGR